MSGLFKTRVPAPSQPTEHEARAESLRALSPVELEWKQKVYDRLLKVLDLSLLTTLEEGVARAQIREITGRLFVELSAPPVFAAAAVSDPPDRRRSDGSWASRAAAGRSRGGGHPRERPARRCTSSARASSN